MHGDIIYLSGMVADDKSLQIGGQTTQILKKLDALLRSLGSEASKLLAVTIYLANIGDKEEMNSSWIDFFEPELLPARATVGVAALGPGTLIEVVAVATK